MPNNRWLCAYTTVLLLLALAGGCATPNRDAYVPAVASPPKDPLNRDARVARAKALEFPTEYVAPPGDPMSHHAAALARVVCAGVFISGLDADFAVANAGDIPPFDVRKDLGKPVVNAAKKTVDVATPKGVVRSAQFVGARQGCVVAAESGAPLHFAPKEPATSLTTTASSPWPAGEVLPQESLPAQIDAAKLKQAVDTAFEPAGAMTSAFVVTWRGKIIAERYAPGITPQTPLESWSMGKTVLAILMGMLVADGTYDLWQPVPIAEWRQRGDPRRDIRIADLLRMSGGLRFRGTLDAESYPAGDYIDNDYVCTADVDVARYVTDASATVACRHRRSLPQLRRRRHCLLDPSRRRGTRPGLLPLRTARTLRQGRDADADARARHLRHAARPKLCTGICSRLGQTREPSAAGWPLEWRGAGAGVLRAFHAHCGARLGGGWKTVVRRIRLVESRESLAWSGGLLCPVRRWRAINGDLPYARSRCRSHGLCQR